MTDEEILKGAIEKAVENGFNWDYKVGKTYDYSAFVDLGTYFSIIFSHDFAKAFWGEKDMWHETDCTCGGVGIHMSDDTHSLECKKVKSDRGYKFHLKQMVLCVEKLKYIEKFL